MPASDYQDVVWVEEGMRVIVPWDHQGRGLWCRVVCAAGDAARVVNENRQVDRWCRLRALRVPRTDVHAWPGGVVPAWVTGKPAGDVAGSRTTG
jgi:hypothetical protein